MVQKFSWYYGYCGFEMESLPIFKIMNMAVFISLIQVMNSFNCILPSYGVGGKIVQKIKLFSLGITTVLEEGMQWIQNL